MQTVVQFPSVTIRSMQKERWFSTDRSTNIICLFFKQAPPIKGEPRKIKTSTRCAVETYIMRLILVKKLRKETGYMKDSNALVSIIVPVYGTEEYLPACIESICKQTYKNLQIILVDDNSPDRCPEICDAYAEKDPRIMVIHQENKGVSGARNTGIHHAIGEYIMFVDSDDELYPDAVADLLFVAMQYEADVVSGMYNLTDSNGNATTLYENDKLTIYRDNEPLLLSLKGDPNTESVWAKLFRNELIQDIHFEEGKNIHEDGFFVFQCYLKKPLLVQKNTSVYRYNIREGSSSRQVFSEKYLSMLYFLERKKSLINETSPQYIECIYNMEARTNLQLLDILCSSTDGNYKELQRTCIKTVRALYKYHTPINGHHKKLAWIVAHGLYPLYKFAVRLKYYR